MIRTPAKNRREIPKTERGDVIGVAGRAARRAENRHGK
jgi:hypothetical protein